MVTGKGLTETLLNMNLVVFVEFNLLLSNTEILIECHLCGS